MTPLDPTQPFATAHENGGVGWFAEVPPRAAETAVVPRTLRASRERTRRQTEWGGNRTFEQRRDLPDGDAYLLPTGSRSTKNIRASRPSPSASLSTRKAKYGMSTSSKMSMPAPVSSSRGPKRSSSEDEID
jgi:hypothetical protein